MNRITEHLLGITWAVALVLAIQVTMRLLIR